MDQEYTRLTTDDIEVLLDALKAWESKDLASDFMVSILGSMLAKTPDEKAEAERDNERHMAESRLKSDQRKETSVILQAKLIQMRQKLTADSLIKSAGLS